MVRDLGVKDLILGTMKSSKSAQLIMKGYQLDEQGKTVLTLKPETDSRDGGYVSSRALTMNRKAILVPRDVDYTFMYGAMEMYHPSVILLDEIQFFTVKQIEALAEISTEYDIDIYAYGLMMSYNGQMFEPVKRAIECGFKINTLKSPCDRCNNDSTHHLLFLNDELQTTGDAINVEDFANKQQRYESVCFKCYMNAIKSKK